VSNLPSSVVGSGLEVGLGSEDDGIVRLCMQCERDGLKVSQRTREKERRDGTDSVLLVVESILLDGELLGSDEAGGLVAHV